jgi:hypothetical protein
MPGWGMRGYSASGGTKSWAWAAQKALWRGVHLERELVIAMIRGLVQILAVGSILLILLRAPDWTSLFLLVSMIFAAGATSARRAKGMPQALRVSTNLTASGTGDCAIRLSPINERSPQGRDLAYVGRIRRWKAPRPAWTPR